LNHENTKVRKHEKDHGGKKETYSVAGKVGDRAALLHWALLVVSHDRDFLDAIGVDRVIELGT
jgi:hypothetical protein